MNIEDKYRAHFKDRKVEVNPKLWSGISKKIEVKQKGSNNWLLAAASILIGLTL